MHWCKYAEDYYKEGSSPPTDGAPVEVMLTAGRDASLQKRPSFRKNLEKLLIGGDEKHIISSCTFLPNLLEYSRTQKDDSHPINAYVAPIQNARVYNLLEPYFFFFF